MVTEVPLPAAVLGLCAHTLVLTDLGSPHLDLLSRASEGLRLCFLESLRCLVVSVGT